jgi:hypothetical protein
MERIKGMSIEHRTPNTEHRTGLSAAVHSVFGVPLLLLLATLFSSLCPAFAVDISSGFDSANKLYAQGKFAEAAAAYEKLIQSGPVSPAIYFNLGNAFFKAGETGRAIAAYRQAEQLAPRDPEIRANLQFARDQVQGPTHLPGRWRRGLQRLTVNEWTALASAALWLWLLLLATTQARPAWKPALKTWTWLAGVATLVNILCLAAVLSVRSTQTAVVVARDATVRMGPLDESPGAFTVHSGAELAVHDTKDDWLQVSAGERRVGWLKRDHALLLKGT